MQSNAQMFRQFLQRRDDAIKLEKGDKIERSLHDEKSFYPALLSDLKNAGEEVIIFSPYVAKFRADMLKEAIGRLRERNVEVFIFTRPLEEYDSMTQPQIECIFNYLKSIGVCIFFPGRYIHQKVAIIDRRVLWEGSLNILSHRASNEMMRRMDDKDLSMQVLNHLGLNDDLVEAYQEKYERMYKSLTHRRKLDIRLRVKMFLLGMAVPVTAWIILSLVYIKPLMLNEMVLAIIRILASKS